MADPLDLATRRAMGERFARNLVAARKATGLSQEMLGFAARLHRTEVGMLERGARIPRLDTLIKLAAVLGISVEQLVAGIEWQVPDLGGGSFDVTSGSNE